MPRRPSGGAKARFLTVYLTQLGLLHDFTGISHNMILTRYLTLSLLLSGSLAAQQLGHPLMVSRHDALPSARPFRTAADTINLLAVMVQFQQDNTPLSSGDGRFDLSQVTDPIIDAAPHNKQYFLDHFTFLANYFRKASSGKVVVRATVLDSVVTLAGFMQNYAPPRVGSTIAVGNLARDTWQKADSANPQLDFSQYQCFVVLHAGIGRDIDLVSLLGYDPTPYDIPSLYIGLSGFQQYYGGTYQGIPVKAGTFFITNSLVIPESENRSLPTATGTTLLELSINGLLCASLGNYLGLPDLFDTNTGQSGIGRFGLMDGQAIFSFKGVFPPEPSAWERYWLGWIQPVTVQVSADTIFLSLPAVSLQDSVYRIPISAQEYFLVENRNRDAQRNGQRVTSRFRGFTRTQTFPRDIPGFNSFEIDSLAGVVTDVEDLDWSLPGGVDENGVFFDGGVLVWHVDESVIAQGLLTNGVNANPLRRGVNLEEADGSQDIGQQYDFLAPGSGSEEGTALDFWFHGNGSPVNKNIFSPTSHPDSRSNSGANSHVTIRDFSDRGPHMTAKVLLGDGVVKPLPGFPKQSSLRLTSPSLTVAPIGNPGTVALIVATTREPSTRPVRGPVLAGLSGEMFAWMADSGRPVLPRELFARSSDVSPLAPPYLGSAAVADINGNGIADVVIADGGDPNGSLHIYQSIPRTLDSLAEILSITPFGRRLTTPPVITDSVIAVGAARATVYLVSRSSAFVDSLSIPGDTSDVAGICALATSGASAHGFVFTTSSGKIGSNLAFISGSLAQSELPGGAAGPPVVGTLGGNQLAVVYVTHDGFVHADRIDNGFPPLQGFPVATGATITQPPALADVDGDGNRDIIVFGGTTIYAYNYAGASLDNFPRQILSSEPITSYPVIADVDGDGTVDIIAVTGDGLVVAYNRNGAMARGFPLQAGAGSQTVAVFAIPSPQLSASDIGLAVASSNDGGITAWKTASVTGILAPNFPWPQYQHDARHSGLGIEPLTGTPISSEFFPASRAYNWPNPVYDGRTFIRYYVKDNATVTIKVFDLAGDLVTTIPNPPGVGGVDNEVVWNVGDVQSGIYFARIEASGASGSGVAVIKVAVVK